MAKRLALPVLLTLLLVGVASSALVQNGWPQWAQNPQHTGMVPVFGQLPKQQFAQVVYDPFVAQEQAEESGELMAHYQVPLVEGNHVYMEFETGNWVPCNPTGSWFGNVTNFCGPNAWNQKIWNEKDLVWSNGQLVANWTFQSDWKPEPNVNGYNLQGFEPVFHAVLADGFVYVPGSGGTIWKVNKMTGSGSQINPFSTIDPNTFVAGPLSADSAGNIYYNVMRRRTRGPFRSSGPPASSVARFYARENSVPIVVGRQSAGVTLQPTGKGRTNFPIHATRNSSRKSSVINKSAKISRYTFQWFSEASVRHLQFDRRGGVDTLAARGRLRDHVAARRSGR